MVYAKTSAINVQFSSDYFYGEPLSLKPCNLNLRNPFTAKGLSHWEVLTCLELEDTIKWSDA